MNKIKEKCLQHKFITCLLIFILGVFVYRVVNHKETETQPKIAIINVKGVITSGENGGDMINGSSVGADTLMSQFRRASKDDSVKAILVRIDSPGGSAAASQEIAEEMQRVKDKGKMIYISMADTAASGGYWLAAYGDKIYANQGTITGSIGVYMGYHNLEALYEKLGVKEEKIKSGAHKDMFSSSREMTSEERQLVQNMVDNMYQQFLQVVAKGRHMSIEQVKPLADGRILTGQQAKEAGLVDEIGNYYDALNDLGKEVGLEENDLVTVTYDDQDSLDKILSAFKVAAYQTIMGTFAQDLPRVQLPH